MIADTLAGLRLPTMHTTPETVTVGGLMSYGPNFAETARRGATYVDISKHVGHVNGYSSVIDEMAA